MSEKWVPAGEARIIETFEMPVTALGEWAADALELPEFVHKDLLLRRTLLDAEVVELKELCEMFDVEAIEDHEALVELRRRRGILDIIAPSSVCPRPSLTDNEYEELLKICRTAALLADDHRARQLLRDAVGVVSGEGADVPLSDAR